MTTLAEGSSRWRVGSLSVTSRICRIRRHRLAAERIKPLKRGLDGLKNVVMLRSEA
jgi:hypothetical protein